MNSMLVPLPCQGTIDSIPIHVGYEWIKKLPNKKIYFALFQRYPDHNLPNGYDFYVVSFHLEAVDLYWLKKQKVSGPILVLFDGNDYGIKIPGVHFVPYFYWHFQLEKMQSWFGLKEKDTRRYKFSSVCNRISQSKLWVTTKLLEVAQPCSLIVLNSWLDPHNVHDWQSTGDHVLDNLTKIFKEKYLGSKLKIDDFKSATQNKQAISANPWQPLYQECAVHFTNESFHYSLMYENEQEYTWPGPFLTEKTFKCLLGGTAFVPVGQFQTYQTLSDLGFNFEYDFATGWDNDAGNISRSRSIIDLIDNLNQHTVEQLISMTEPSSLHNQNHVLSKKFFNLCQQKNKDSIDHLFKLIST
jgi:hypothetical protein